MVDYALEYIKEIFSGDSSGHDYYHTVRVYKIATEIAKQEYADVNIVQLAALLHDMRQGIFTHCTGNFQQERGLPIWYFCRGRNSRINRHLWWNSNGTKVQKERFPRLRKRSIAGVWRIIMATCCWLGLITIRRQESTNV